MSWENIIKIRDICEICKSEGPSNFEAVKKEKDGYFKVIRYCKTCSNPVDITEDLLTAGIHDRKYK